MEMRALWSQLTFSCFFSILMSTFGKWTFINVQIRKTLTKPENVILLNLYINTENI